MTRDYSPESAAAVSGSIIRGIHLVELELDPYTLRLSDAYKDLEWDGEIYTRGGNLLGVTDVEETAALMIHEVTVSLSGVDQAMVALVLQEDYIDRTLRIWRGFLNDDFSALVSVEPYFEGRINRPAIAEDPVKGTSTVAIAASSAWVDFERSPGRRTNHEQQQQWFPGDMGFEFAGRAFNELPWGRGLTR